jgi:endonuclease/exonuclease/phosphatase family metal-dependent hydrolase
VTGDAKRSIRAGDSLALISYNIGYGALGAGQDFFMDGGEMVRPDSKDVILENMAGIREFLANTPADVYLIQEVDIKARRSFYVDQMSQLIETTQKNAAFAYNFKSLFTPFPIPPIGKAESGLLTLTDLEIHSAERISLPVPFSWPISMFNLKRCLLLQRIPAGQQELVLINLHLEAYDDGEGKKEQMAMLMDLLIEEYEKGNYVIAGGDFNHIFPGSAYPDVYPDLWIPGELEESILPDGWQFAFDKEVPSCRLLNKPFNGNYHETQLFVIDGFIISPNIRLDSVRTIDLSFEHADHQPVMLHVTLN